MPRGNAIELSWAAAACGLLVALGLLGCSTSAKHPTQAASPEASTSSESTIPSGTALPGTSNSADASALPQARPSVVPTEPEVQFDHGTANQDPNDDFVVGPPETIPDCDARLAAANVQFRAASLPVVKKGALTCGAPQVVVYLKGPTGMRIYPPPLVTCTLALALARFEQVIERTAVEMLGSRVVSVTQGGTYSCRSMARFRQISEHSYANAIDLYAFRLADGRTISVLRHFGDPKQEPKDTESRFLRELAHRLFDEKVFSVVVTRFYDDLHRDHIHGDMAHYRVDGSR